MNRWQQTAGWLALTTLTGLTVLAGSTASAQTLPADSAVLLIGVLRDTHLDARLTRALGDQLEHTGVAVLRNPSLSTSEKTCTDQECMESLARREGAGVAVTAQVRENSPGSFSVTVALLDLERHKPVQDEAFCDPCEGDALRVKLGDLADKVWRAYRGQNQPPVAGGTPMVPTVPMVPTGPAGESLRRGAVTAELAVKYSPAPSSGSWPTTLSPRRKLIAGVLGGLAGAALITSAVLTAKNHSEISNNCGVNPCVLWTVPFYATGYALTAGLAGATALTLFLPENHASSDKR